MNDRTRALVDALGALSADAGRATKRVMRSFHFMGIAEAELARAFPGGRNTEPAGLMWMLCQTGEMRSMADDVYRAHARELCERASKTGNVKDLVSLTKAELIVGFYASSLEAPLNGVGSALYCRLFAELFPGKMPEAEEQSGWLADEVESTLAVLLRKTSPERAQILRELGGGPRRRSKSARANMPEASRKGPRPRVRRG
jgi:hypothetical protein